MRKRKTRALHDETNRRAAEIISADTSLVGGPHSLLAMWARAVLTSAEPVRQTQQLPMASTGAVVEQKQTTLIFEGGISS